MYTFSGALRNGILPGENSLCTQVLRSPVLAALQHGSGAAVGCGMVQGMELWNFRSASFSTEGTTYIPRAAITLGIGPHSSYYE